MTTYTEKAREIHEATPAITPRAVRDVRFTATRFREGYDVNEVDEFLDAVEAEMLRLRLEVGRLRGSASEAAQLATDCCDHCTAVMR